jgi:hypothetical protein
VTRVKLLLLSLPCSRVSCISAVVHPAQAPQHRFCRRVPAAWQARGAGSLPDAVHHQLRHANTCSADPCLPHSNRALFRTLLRADPSLPTSSCTHL